METDSGSEQLGKQYAPTVSMEKRRSHALMKLSRGYVLIIGTQRRTANFFLRGKGFEMCDYEAARQLVKEGAIVKAYDHYLGTAYTLAETTPVPTPTPRPARQEEPREPLDTLLDELDKGAPDDDITSLVND